MIKSLWLKITVVTSILSLSASVTPAEQLDSQQTESLAPAEEQEKEVIDLDLDELQKITLLHLNTLAGHITDIMQRVHQKIFKAVSPEDKIVLNEKMIEVGRIVQQSYSTVLHLAPLSLEPLYQAQQVVYEVTCYIRKITRLLQRQPFTNIPDFILSDIPTKTIPEPEVIIQEIKTNKKKIKALDNFFEFDFGLTSGNKRFRGLEKLWKKYDLGTYIPTIGLLTLATTLCLHSTGLLNDVLGLPVVRSQVTLEFSDTDKLTNFPAGVKTLGKATDYFNRMCDTRWAKEIYGTAFLYFAGSKWRAIKDYVIKWKNDTFNSWRGGAYLNKINYTPLCFDDLEMTDLDYLRQEFEPLFTYIKNPDLFRQKGFILETGYLFTGPSGVGKTIIAKAIEGELIKRLEQDKQSKLKNKKLTKAKKEQLEQEAKELVNFHVFNAVDILQYGLSRINLHARSNPKAKVIICFIDEIAHAGLQSTNNMEKLAEARTVLDGFYSKNNPDQVVIFITATSSPELIDNDLKRHGRLGKIIRFNKPTLQSRYNFLAQALQKLALDITQFDLESIAYETEGHTLNDLSKVMSTMTTQAQVKNRPITQELLEDAIDVICRNIRKNDIIPLAMNEIAAIATQQTGTAAAHILLNSQERVSKVTIEPITSKLREQKAWDQVGKNQEEKQPEIYYGECFTYCPGTFSLNGVMKIKALLAGNIAQKILLGDCEYQYNPYNRIKALDLALNLVAKGPFIPSLYAKAKQEAIKKEALELIEQYEEELTALFTTKQKQLMLIANLVMINKQATGKTITEVLAMSDEKIDAIIADAQNQAVQPEPTATQDEVDEVAEAILSTKGKPVEA